MSLHLPKNHNRPKASLFQQAGVLMLNTWRKGLSQGKRLIGLLLPPHCLICDVPVLDDHSLCSPCWQKLDFITSPLCKICGGPFEITPDIIETTSDDMLCGLCLANPPAFDRLRHVLSYDQTSRKLITAFKHSDRTDLLPLFHNWLKAVIDQNHLLADVDLIIPIPINYWRLLARRYNQAALLARVVSASYQVKTHPDILKRHKRTKPQGHLTRRQRQQNLKGAFAISAKHRRLIDGKTILIIDDVYTTGATIDQAAKTLRKYGAKEVRALTIARVVRPSSV